MLNCRTLLVTHFKYSSVDIRLHLSKREGQGPTAQEQEGGVGDITAAIFGKSIYHIGIVMIFWQKLAPSLIRRRRGCKRITCIAFASEVVAGCWGPVGGTPPVAKVMRKEARHTQRRDRDSGVPLEILEHLPPSPEPAYLTILCSHLHLWLYGGLSPTTSLWKRVNLQLSW